MATILLRRAQQIANRISTESAFEIEEDDERYGGYGLRRKKKIKAINPSTSTTIDGDPIRRIEQLRTALLLRTNRMIKLIEIGSQIRQAMALKQAQCGVSELVTERVGLVKKQTILEYLLDSIEKHGALDQEEVSARINSMQKRLSTGTTHSSATADLSTGLLTKDDQGQFQEQLTQVKRRLLDIDDRLAQLNASNSIEVSDEIEKFLRELSIA